MKQVFKKLRPFTVASAVGFALGISSGAQAALDDIVVIKGSSTDTQTMSFNMNGQQVQGDPAVLCQNFREFLYVNGMLNMGGGYAGPGAEFLDMIYPTDAGMDPAGAALEECANTTPSNAEYTIMFTSCSMHMFSGDSLLIWVVPPEVPEAMMIIVNLATSEIITGSMLNSDLEAVPIAAQGQSTLDQSVRGTGGTEDWVVLVTDGPPTNTSTATETFTASIYDFDYKGAISMPGMEGVALSLGEISSDGVAHIVPDFPGNDVIGRFYKNFRDEVVPSLQANSMMTQAFEQMADLASRGVPVHTQQTITMGGGLMSMAGSAGAGAGSTSTNTVEAVAVWDGGAAQSQVCGYAVTPEGWTETSMDEMMAGAMGGAGGSAGGMTPEQQAEVQAGMAELNKAMDSLTPEQKEAISGLGLGGLIPGMSDEPAAAPAGSAAGSATRSASRSSGLMTDNMTQSVQLHLQALGIDPGNTNGNLDMNTQIAISQFQASKGMKPTGEVSPQLLGVLAAEVDK